MKTMRQTGEYWSQKIREYRASGMSAKEFCKREGISYWTFRDRIKKENTNSKPESFSLVKIQRTGTIIPEAPAPHINIYIGNNLIIKVERNFDAELLRAIVHELGRSA